MSMQISSATNRIPTHAQQASLDWKEAKEDFSAIKEVWTGAKAAIPGDVANYKPKTGDYFGAAVLAGVLAVGLTARGVQNTVTATCHAAAAVFE